MSHVKEQLRDYHARTDYHIFLVRQVVIGGFSCLKPEGADQILDTHLMVGGYAFENAMERPCPYRIVIRNDLVVLSISSVVTRMCEPFLAGSVVTKFSQRGYQIGTGNVAGKPHLVRTSSRTK